MKRIKYLLLCVIEILIAFACLITVSLAEPSDEENIIMLPEKGECISKNEFKVIQVLEPTVALAVEKSLDQEGTQFDIFSGVVALFTNDGGKYYYDDEIIKIPAGKCVRQIGIYRYMNKMDDLKTVPVVIID
ncbi:MAG: hypothetical protein LBH40_02875 [Alphaproteobacteria bacterium]|jgi:hypothetical protein|nr:hypothetical protein [Alphaproteobacteria bacterium]